MTFKDKVVLVTGASSGIGAAIAVQFSKDGANVAIVGRNKLKLKSVSEKCERYGSKPFVIIADITDDAKMKAMVDDVIKHFGKLNILINNAGIAGTESIISENVMKFFDQMMATNLRSIVYLTHLTVPHLIETKGNIINISSIASSAVLLKDNFSYCVSKAGVDHFTRSIAFDLASKGVRVNAVNPGPVRTDFMEKIQDKATREKIWDMIMKGSALGRIAEPEEIADLVLFLASDKAKSITGVSHVIDNGFLLKGSLEN